MARCNQEARSLAAKTSVTMPAASFTNATVPSRNSAARWGVVCVCVCVCDGLCVWTMMWLADHDEQLVSGRVFQSCGGDGACMLCALWLRVCV